MEGIRGRSPVNSPGNVWLHLWAWTVGAIIATLLLIGLPAYGQDAGPTSEDEHRTETLIDPGTDLPPYVQLTPDSAPVVWDPEVVGDFQLIDQNGNEVTRETLLGRPWIANFIFTRCVTQCPMTCRKIMELSESLPDTDVRFVTITVDPEHDGVEKMAEFASIWQADPDRWLFLTGEKEAVYDLIRNAFKVAAWENFGTSRQPGYEFAHNNHLLHIDAEGRILGRYDSVIDEEVMTLRRVLKGDIETPEDFRPAVATSDPREENAAEKAATNEEGDLPPWAARLPATNAMLNGLAAILLMMGFTAIKAGRQRLHKQLMLTAFGVSVLFLACYLTYHQALHHYTGTHGKSFEGTGVIRTVYFTVLISHVVLAALVPVLAIVTIVKGLRARWESHRRWAKVTFPIWLYVSVTGVIIYWMLYKM